MKTESSIKTQVSSTTIKPLTDSEEIIKAIEEWNGITHEQFINIVGDYKIIGKREDNSYIYTRGDEIINPIGIYLLKVYSDKEIVFEKDNDKYFGTIEISPEITRYMLGEKVIEIPYRIKAVNRDTQEFIIIFPKSSDILERRMKGMYVVNTGWADRQRIEKEIMAKLIELAQVRGGNEIISTQSVLESLQETLKKRDIVLELESGQIYLNFPRREIRDTANIDKDYLVPPITICIDFDSRIVQCMGLSPHGFGSPTSYGSPCWGTWENEIRHGIQDCDMKGLINLIISWAYGYNSDDTGRTPDGRHPIGVLKEYMNYLRNNRGGTYYTTQIEGVKKHIKEIKEALADYLDNRATTDFKDFISSLEQGNEESEQG